MNQNLSNQNPLLGLKNVKINSFNELNGSIEILIESNSSYATCPKCNNPSNSIKDHHTHSIVDKPASNIPVKISITKKTLQMLLL